MRSVSFAGLIFVAVVILTAKSTVISRNIKTTLDLGQNEKEEFCPCMEKSSCPRIYGQSAMDIREIGFLPACQDFGTVRCCGVSIRIEQDYDREKMDWSNLDIKSKNNDLFGDESNNVSKGDEDLMSLSSDQISQTASEPRRTIVKLRRRKPFQIGSKDTKLEASESIHSPADGLQISEIGSDSDKTISGSATLVKKLKQQSKTPNTNILKLRRPVVTQGNRPVEPATSSGTVTITGGSSITKNGDSSTLTTERPRISSLIGGRKRVQNSFTPAVTQAEVTQTGGNNFNLLNSQRGSEATLEIKEKLNINAPTSSLGPLTSIPARPVHLLKIRPFIQKGTSGSPGNQANSAQETTPSNSESDSLLQTRPRPRPRRPSATLTPLKKSDLPNASNSFQLDIEPKVGQISQHFSTTRPEPEFTSKRPKYMRKRVRPVMTTELPEDPLENYSTDGTPTPTLTDTENSDHINPALTSTVPLSAYDSSKLPSTTQKYFSQISIGELIPENKFPISTQVSYSISSEVGVQNNRKEEKQVQQIPENFGGVEQVKLVPVQGQVAFDGVLITEPTTTTTQPPPLEIPRSTERVLIYSIPTKSKVKSSQVALSGTTYYNKHHHETPKHHVQIQYAEEEPLKSTISLPQPLPQAKVTPSYTRTRFGSQFQSQDEENGDRTTGISPDSGKSGKRRFEIPSQFKFQQSSSTDELTEQDNLAVTSTTKQSGNSYFQGSVENGKPEPPTRREGSENYDLVLNEKSRGASSQSTRKTIVTPRQRNRFHTPPPNYNQRPTFIYPQNSMSDLDSTAPQGKDEENHHKRQMSKESIISTINYQHQDNSENLFDLEDEDEVKAKADESEQETRMHLEIIKNRQHPNILTDDSGLTQEQVDLIPTSNLRYTNRRGRPKTRKQQTQNTNTASENPSSRVIVPVPVAIPFVVQISDQQSTEFGSQYQPKQNTGSRPVGYKRIRNKPALLLQTENENENSYESSLQTTELMNSGDGDAGEIESSTTKFIFPPYQYHISSRVSSTSPSPPQANEPNSAAHYIQKQSLGLLDILKTPLHSSTELPSINRKRNRNRNRNNTHTHVNTEQTYSYQVPPTDDPYLHLQQSVRTTSLPAPQPTPTIYRSQENFYSNSNSNLKRNSTRFSVPAPTPSMNTNANEFRFGFIQPGHPDYVKFPVEEELSYVPQRQTQKSTKAEAEAETDSLVTPGVLQTVMNIDNSRIPLEQLIKHHSQNQHASQQTVLIKASNLPNPEQNIEQIVSQTKKEQSKPVIEFRFQTPESPKQQSGEIPSTFQYSNPNLNVNHPYYEEIETKKEIVNPLRMNTLINISDIGGDVKVHQQELNSYEPSAALYSSGADIPQVQSPGGSGAWDQNPSNFNYGNGQVNLSPSPSQGFPEQQQQSRQPIVSSSLVFSTGISNEPHAHVHSRFQIPSQLRNPVEETNVVQQLGPFEQPQSLLQNLNYPAAQIQVPNAHQTIEIHQPQPQAFSSYPLAEAGNGNVRQSAHHQSRQPTPTQSQNHIAIQQQQQSSRPHYITEYHHHHSITQQILSRLRNSVRTSRATNLTLEDIDWLSSLVDEENIGPDVLNEQIQLDADEEAMVASLEAKLYDQVLTKDEKKGNSTKNITTTMTGVAINLLDENSDNSSKRIGPSGNAFKNSEEKKVGEKVEKVEIEEKVAEKPDKGRFRVPKMLQRGFFPILPYSESDPGPVLVRTRSSAPNTNHRVSRQFSMDFLKEKDLISFIDLNSNSANSNVNINGNTNRNGTSRMT